MADFAERVRELRARKGITQEDLAELLNLSRPTIAGYESPHKGRIPRREILKKMSEIFNVSVGYILGIAENSENDKSTIDNGSRTEQDMTYIDEQPGIKGLENAYTFDERRLVHVPIVAEISCGEPVVTEANIVGYFPVDRQFVHMSGDANEYVYMRAIGNSMINVHIGDGSLVLLRLQNTADSGDIVAVCVDDEKATLKRIYLGANTITLVPENPTMQPKTYDARRIRVVAKAVWTATHL